MLSVSRSAATALTSIQPRFKSGPPKEPKASAPDYLLTAFRNGGAGQSKMAALGFEDLRG
jgi:hypothetical protein